MSTNCKFRITNSTSNPFPYSVVSDSNFTIDSALNVELESFTSNVSGSSIQLDWTTAFEKNNLGFEIDRKLGSEVWQNIGFVSSQGSSASPENYSFSDELDTSSFIGDIFYRIKQIDVSGTSQYIKEIKLNVNLTPQTFVLFNNYPNPFNPNTLIKYSLPTNSRVEIKVYNIVGQLVSELINTIQTTGDHKIVFNAAGLPSGIYFDVLEAKSLDGKQGSTLVKKMVLLK